MRALTTGLLTLALAPACALGPRVADFAPARSPEGAPAQVVSATAAVLKGELLDVRDHDLLLRAAGRVTSVPLGRLTRASVPGLRIELESGSSLSATDREQLRLLSRFPQHLSPELLNALLAACGQTRLEVWP